MTLISCCAIFSTLPGWFGEILGIFLVIINVYVKNKLNVSLIWDPDLNNWVPYLMMMFLHIKKLYFKRWF